LRISKTAKTVTFSDQARERLWSLLHKSADRLLVVGVDEGGKMCLAGDLSGCGETVVDAGLRRVYDEVVGVMGVVNPLVGEALE
jgi:hypothetical protein